MLQSNFIGTYNVFEAARQNGVKRVAYASRAGVLTLYPRSIHRTVDMTTTPVGIYTVSKVFGEGLAPLFLPHQHDMEFVCVRIGNFNLKRRPTRTSAPSQPRRLRAGF